MPVFVLTHHPREPLVMLGGTTFHFVTDGLDAALARAREAAGDRDILIGGGASTIRQCLAVGVVDEFLLSIAPILLGDGERLLGGLPPLELEQVRTVGAPDVTHIAYRVVR
jgi:dihydrofolate reductase